MAGQTLRLAGHASAHASASTRARANRSCVALLGKRLRRANKGAADVLTQFAGSPRALGSYELVRGVVVGLGGAKKGASTLPLKLHQPE